MVRAVEGSTPWPGKIDWENCPELGDIGMGDVSTAKCTAHQRLYRHLCCDPIHVNPTRGDLGGR